VKSPDLVFLGAPIKTTWKLLQCLILHDRKITARKHILKRRVEFSLMRKISCHFITEFVWTAFSLTKECNRLERPQTAYVARHSSVIIYAANNKVLKKFKIYRCGGNLRVISWITVKRGKTQIKMARVCFWRTNHVSKTRANTRHFACGSTCWPGE
jgi:hypothetical protein